MWLLLYGIFCVLEPREKDFIVDFEGGVQRISVDCLKRTRLDLNKPVKLALPGWQGHPWVRVGLLPDLRVQRNCHDLTPFVFC